MILRPLFLALLFCYGPSAGAALPLDLFWHSAAELDLQRPHTLVARPSQLLWEVGHDQLWRDGEGDERGASELGQRRLMALLQLPLGSEQQLSLAVGQAHHYAALALDEPDGALQLQRQVDERQWAFHWQWGPLAYGRFDSGDSRGQQLTWQPHPHATLYYQQSQQQQRWQADAWVQREASSVEVLLDGQQAVPRYQLSAEPSYRLDMKEIGGQWNGALGAVAFAHQQATAPMRDTMAERWQLDGRWDLLPDWSLSWQWQRTTEPLLGANLLIDQRTAGAILFNSAHEVMHLGLQLPRAVGGAEIYLRQGEWLTDLWVPYDASVMAGYWSSLLVGGGELRQQTQVQYQGAGLVLKSGAAHDGARQGWLRELHLGVGRASWRLAGHHHVRRFPVGYLLRDPLDEPTQQRKLLLLGWGLGYRWQRFELSYRFEQLVPLESGAGDEATTPPAPAPTPPSPTDPTEPASPSPGTPTTAMSEAPDRAIQLPDGNRQWLMLRYRF